MNTADASPWRHWCDNLTQPGFIGMAQVHTVDGKTFVGDLWRTAGGWTELLPLGEDPLVMEWIPVSSITLLDTTQQAQVKSRPSAPPRRRRSPQQHPTTMPPLPECGTSEAVLLT